MAAFRSTEELLAWLVDFVGSRDGQLLYIQVATSIQDARTRDREYRSLESIRDNYPKLVLSLDSHRSHEGGILHIPLRRFLLDPPELV